MFKYIFVNSLLSVFNKSKVQSKEHDRNYALPCECDPVIQVKTETDWNSLILNRYLFELYMTL